MLGGLGRLSATATSSADEIAQAELLYRTPGGPLFPNVPYNQSWNPQADNQPWYYSNSATQNSLIDAASGTGGTGTAPAKKTGFDFSLLSNAATAYFGGKDAVALAKASRTPAVKPNTTQPKSTNYTAYIGGAAILVIGGLFLLYIGRK